jgi:hypothetical protein
MVTTLTLAPPVPCSFVLGSQYKKGAVAKLRPLLMKKQSLEAAKAATQALFFGRIDV